MSIYKKIFKKENKILPQSQTIKIPYYKIKFAYAIYNNTEEMEVMDSLYIQNTVNFSKEEQTILEKLSKNYTIKMKRKTSVNGYRAFRVKFKGKTFDIVSFNYGYKLYKPLNNDLKNDFVDGEHIGKLIDGFSGVDSYLNILYLGAEEQWEKEVFGLSDWKKNFDFIFESNKIKSIKWCGKTFVEAIYPQ